MNKLAQAARGPLTILLLVMSSSSPVARPVRPFRIPPRESLPHRLEKKQQTKTGAAPVPKASAQPLNARSTYIKAFVIDDRLSALRRKPGLKAEVIRRLRLGHAVFIVATTKAEAGEPRFCRVAVTRRTRGWIHESALAAQARTGEDQRIMKLIQDRDGADRITLCKILNQHFGKSRLAPRAMLLLGEEAERVAEALSQRTRRRLAEVRAALAGIRDYYLSDAGLDRYSKLGVVFDFNESTGEFVYDGKAYRDVLRLFPRSEEAALARQRLALASRKAAP